MHWVEGLIAAGVLLPMLWWFCRELERQDHLFNQWEAAQRGEELTPGNGSIGPNYDTAGGPS